MALPDDSCPDLTLAPAVHAGKKKKKVTTEAPKPAELPEVDTSNLVWPDPPDIARIRWLEQYRGEPKPTQAVAEEKKKKKKTKEAWMLRLAGVQPLEAPKTIRNSSWSGPMESRLIPKARFTLPTPM